MKPLLFVFQLFVVAPVILGQPFGLNLADLSAADGWPALSLGDDIFYLTLLGWIGILLTIVGYRLFDRSIREELPQRIVEPTDGETGG